MEKSRVILVTTVSLHFVMGKKYVTVELRGKWDEGLRNFPVEEKVVLGGRGRIKGGLDLIVDT